MPGLSSADTSPSVRQEFGIPDDAPVVLMVARLQRWKGVHVLVDAAANVVKNQPRARFIVVGGTLFGLEKDYALELRQQVERLKLIHAVTFAEFRSDMFRFYSAADLVVHCSIQPEPFGMVLLEAMAHGKPVVASDSGGPREIVERGVTGLLVPPEDAEGLARAILMLLGDPGRGVRMGQAGAARFRSLFSAERMVRQLECVYEQMLDEKVPG
jgi:glycosyltransferase involved in cell wall biosynthesis